MKPKFCKFIAFIVILLILGGAGGCRTLFVDNPEKKAAKKQQKISGKMLKATGHQ